MGARRIAALDDQRPPRRASHTVSPKARSLAVSEPLVDHRGIRAALRRSRATWILLLANALPLYALPLAYQALYETRAWPEWYEVGQVAPGDLLRGTWWLRAIAPCCVFLALAAVIPSRLHARRISRLRLPLVEGALEEAMSYRHPAKRQIMVDVRGLRAFAAAYDVRLAMVVGLLLPALVRALAFAAPIRSYGSCSSPGITFSSPLEYLPVLAAATMVVLLNAPTMGRMLGRRDSLRLPARRS